VPHSLLSPLKVIERKWQMSASGTKRNLSPLPKPRLHCAHLVLLKGRCREALRRRDGVRCPRVLRNKALGRHFGAPPGTIRSPCQELADRPAIAGNGKRGPVLAKRRNGAPEGARAVPPEPRHHRFASFGAPSPYNSMGADNHTPDAGMRRGKELACLIAAVQQTPYLPLVGRSDDAFRRRRGGGRGLTPPGALK
jgi:hypothetical protein